jgi:hypothetical protein
MKREREQEKQEKEKKATTRRIVKESDREIVTERENEKTKVYVKVVVRDR